MPRHAVGHRFTIFDKMEADGVFAANPANSHARDENGSNIYTGPVEYPKMLFHPEGEERIVSPGEEVISPMRGAILVGQQKELINRTVQNAEQEAEALAEGWHLHPVDAVRARVMLGIAAGTHTEKDLKKLPVKPVAPETVANMQTELEQLRKEKAEREGPSPVPPK